MVRLRAVEALAIFVVVASGCAAGGPQDESAATANESAENGAMPNVIGMRLDDAKSAIESSGFSGEVEVVGGGAFGVVVESNWQVCEQSPSIGRPIDDSPQLSIARACDAPNPSSGDASEVSAFSNTEVPDRETNLAGNQIEFRFGEAAPFTATTRVNGLKEEIPLLITVSAPQEFTPASDALVTDLRAEYAVVPTTLNATNIFFTVTIQNLSDTYAYSPFLIPDVRETAQDDDVASVTDSFVGGLNGLGQVPPRQTISLRDGYSVASAQNVRYELGIDGLAGYTIYFTRSTAP